jgi:hypothetical protein
MPPRPAKIRPPDRLAYFFLSPIPGLPSVDLTGLPNSSNLIMSATSLSRPVPELPPPPESRSSEVRASDLAKITKIQFADSNRDLRGKKFQEQS